MSVKEKLKNGKDRVVKFVDDHKVDVAIVGTFAVTSIAMLIAGHYDCKHSYKRGWSDGAHFGCTDGIDRALHCLSDHTDLTDDDINNTMMEFAQDYGLRQKKTE